MSQNLQPLDWMAPGANIAAYIQGANAVALLSAEEERALAEDLYYREDLESASTALSFVASPFCCIYCTLL